MAETAAWATLDWNIQVCYISVILKGIIVYLECFIYLDHHHDHQERQESNRIGFRYIDIHQEGY